MCEDKYSLLNYLGFSKFGKFVIKSLIVLILILLFGWIIVSIYSVFQINNYYYGCK